MKIQSSDITGLHPKKVAAALDNYGMELDLNANMLVEYENGVHGVYSCSQVCAGHLNGLTVRIFGTKGAIEWVQEDPNYLKVTKKKGQPVQIYHRGTGIYNRAWSRAESHSFRPSCRRV